ncbi:GOLPH3/VPS74 family protein [Streptomyces chiangmaiensis]|uniref:GPP34 family phosphoprotein n=1 Tax=Streptomyces chiangmaiensis TaxID=766497 RepID=A0ABU7FD71_9ACTN|nr:GPP34 family phosphoprotein [Streptomyces chiangmaiensis]MED7822044.1 GPP34 family phosphoprotein [Streptomyces chiangmaiensis]
MTTARDLLIVALDATPGGPAEPGDLSLSLAGAELIDLVDARAITLDGDRIVAADPPVTDDRLVQDAASSLVRQMPYESVEDWLWRRGRGLSSAYLAAFEEEGQFRRQRRRWLPSWTGEAVLVDSPARRRAADRWAAREPVLATLAATAGIGDTPAGELPDEIGEVAATVLAAVDDAVTELTAVRQRRDIEKAAFDNIWRGPV